MDNRYSRQILFPPIGKEGQAKLNNKHILVIGLGTLGAQSSEMFARAGVGRLTIVDRDYVEWSNLQRQPLYTEDDAKQQIPKAIAAKKRLEKINSEIDIISHIVDVTPEEIEWLVKDVDIIIDATDNFDIRMMINDISQKKQIPWIFGSCVGSYGMSLTIIPRKTSCLHCLIEKIPIGGQTCDTAGIIMPAASRVVTHQVTEALKILTNNDEELLGKLLSFDLWSNEEVKMNVSALKKSICPSCSPQATYPFLQMEQQTKSAVLCGRESVQIRPAQKQDRNLTDLAEQLKKTSGKVEQNPYLLSYTVDKHRLVIFKDGRAIVHGTKDIEKARTLYYRYFG